MLGRCLAKKLDEHELSLVDIEDFDIANPAAVDAAVASLRPETVIHCAAMTAVDKAEVDSDAAFRVNVMGSANLARACQRRNIRLIAFSTDYIFSGDLGRPFHEWDLPGPKTVYGKSKLAGEEAIRHGCPDHLICRLAWLYGQGGPSFLHAMLKLGREADAPVKVVTDQMGNPTSTLAVAEHIKLLVKTPISGVIHLTCEGEASWHDFAREIFRLWDLSPDPVPCLTGDFPRPAPRPADSRLEKRSLRLLGLPNMPDWRQALHEFRQHYPDG
jgi:dTDP-4-dehydrorhamnose reductase